MFKNCNITGGCFDGDCSFQDCSIVGGFFEIAPDTSQISGGCQTKNNLDPATQSKYSFEVSPFSMPLGLTGPNPYEGQTNR